MITHANLVQLAHDVGAAFRDPLGCTAHVRLLAHGGNGPRLLALLREPAPATPPKPVAPICLACLTGAWRAER